MVGGVQTYESWPGLRMEAAAFEALRFLGYSGDGECLVTAAGFVFVQGRVERSSSLKLFVAADIK